MGAQIPFTEIKADTSDNTTHGPAVLGLYQTTHFSLLTLADLVKSS